MRGGGKLIIYDPFWQTLKSKHISTYMLIQKHGMSSSTLSRLRNNAPITTTTLNDLCKFLDCPVTDILKYVPEDNETAD